MEWYQELESRVVPPARAAARATSNKVKNVGLELENGSLAVSIAFGERLSPEDKKAISEAIRNSFAHLVADAQRLKIRFRWESRFYFTVHFDIAGQSPAIHGELHRFTRFTIPASALFGLRRAYGVLFNQSQQFDYTATTALGGIPALLYLVTQIEETDRPLDPNERNDFYEELRKRFHLLPGLNWSGTNREKDVLFDWLANLPPGASALLFDTGTKGNSIRQMANLIRHRLSENRPFGPTSVRIIGIVDGHDPSQRPSEEVVETARGPVRLSVCYEHVPRMLTEDCQQLIGYSAIRKEVAANPVRANAVMEIVDDDGHRIYSCGALSASSLIRSVTEKASNTRPRDATVSEFLNRAICFAVSYFSIGKEFEMLQNAHEYGLLDDDTAQSLEGDLERKYRQTVLNDAFPHIDLGK